MLKGYNIFLISVMSTTAAADEMPKGPLLPRYRENIDKLFESASSPAVKPALCELPLHGIEPPCDDWEVVDMEQKFTESESIYLEDRVSRYVEELVEHTIEIIADIESTANSDFASRGIVFTEHSPANADYLTVALMESLFSKVHQGDVVMAEWMLTMMAKQLGISTRLTSYSSDMASCLPRRTAEGSE
ncbi:hypothetical protein [Pseudomonas sp.]|uniref:hypothetical protein n=1 Tax=Pseudomonas sp. TaxID=306 RepID=UPI003262EC0A